MLIEKTKKLTEINGVSGDEGAVREYIKSQISEYADQVFTDTMGNIIALKKGNSEKNGKKLKELLGHTPVEVFAGAVLGIITGIIRHI